MTLTTDQEYEAARNEWIDLTIEASQRNQLRDPPTPRMLELQAAFRAYEASHPLYRIQCIKDFYAGQGVDWEIGQVYSEYHSKREADETLALLNRDGWGKDCWEMIELPVGTRPKWIGP